MHQAMDAKMEEWRKNESVSKQAIGTTKRGIGPCYSSKMLRNGLRVGDLLHFDEFKTQFEELAGFFRDKYGIETDVAAELQK